MISVSEAKQLILENCDTPIVKTSWLLKANGFVLAEPVFSLIDSPPFDQSAMDGYAFSHESWDGKSDLSLTEEIQAGSFSNRVVKGGEVVRIYTGAALPNGADTVVMQEKVVKVGNEISVQDKFLVKGNNIRKQGSQIKSGEIALAQGQLLTPTGVSFLASIGITKVNVYENPTISIIVTGKELIKAGMDLSSGKIYESNSIGLTAALQQLNIEPVSVEIVDDAEEEIIMAINRGLKSDILILTGGVSVGDYDLVPASLEKCGVEKLFHKVKQKPGMPFYFGKHLQTLVFGLPGNPAAVFSCFYEYIVPAISSYTHKKYFDKRMLPLENNFNKKQGLTNFLKGKTGDQNVTILNNQESYLLNSFAVADCLVELIEEKDNYRKGDLVSIGMII